MKKCKSKCVQNTVKVESNDVPTMNLVWFGPAALTMLCCVLFIRSSDPPSPPRFVTFSILDKLYWNCDKDIFFCSLSAELAAQQERKTLREYLANMKVAESSGS